MPHETLVSYGSNAMGDVPVPFRDLLFQSLTLRFFVVYDLLPEDRRAALDGAEPVTSRAVLKPR